MKTEKDMSINPHVYKAGYKGACDYWRHQSTTFQGLAAYQITIISVPH